MKYRLICFLWLILPAAACMQETPVNVTDTDVSAQETAGYEAGMVRVYVDEELAASLEAEAVSGPATKAVSGLGEVRMERTFPHAGRFEARTRKAGLHRWYDVWFDDSTPLTKAGESLERLPGIEEVEFRPRTVKNFTDLAWQFQPVPGLRADSSAETPFNDPRFAEQWNLFNDGSLRYSVAGCDVNAVPAWNKYSTGNPEVIVSVVDGGIDFTHEDLAANMWTDPSHPESAIYGYNFYDETTAISATSHGTHVGGIIAAVNNNGKGVCGIAGGNAEAGLPGVRLMSCQIFKEGIKEGASGARAIKWGADHGAVISQNSWGYDEIGYIPRSDREAIDYFNTYAGFDENGVQVGPMAGGIVIFAAGNEDCDYGSPGVYEGALSVSSLGPDFRRAYYSNYGDWVDIAAPGGEDRKITVLSTLPGNNYGLMQGTSMACPHVSGVAALIVSQLGGPGFTRTMLWNRLVNTTSDISPWNTGYALGSGLVDAFAAIDEQGGSAPEAVTDFQAWPLKADKLSFSLTLTRNREGELASGCMVYFSHEPFTDPSMLEGRMFMTDTVSSGTLQGVISGLEFESTYYLACEAFDRMGKRSALSNQVRIETGPNHRPVIRALDSCSLTLKAHETGTIEAVFTDEDDHTIYAWLQAASAADKLLFLDDSTARIEIHAPQAKAGNYASQLVVADEYDAETVLNYSYTILPNHAPVVVKEVEDMVFSVIGETNMIDLHSLFEDPDGETPAYSVSSPENPALSVRINDGKLFLSSIRYGYTGITLTATDALGETASLSFRTLSRDGSKPVDIYPTTVTDGKLYFRTSEESGLNVRVISETGTAVITGDFQAAPFKPAVLDMSQLAAGLYTVEVDSGGQKTVQTVTKL